MKNLNEQEVDRNYDEFISAFCTYGSMDIRFAVKEAMNAGKDGQWAYDQIEEYADSCDVKIKDCDPCYVVMQSILQEARNEISDLTDFDIQNDADFDVDGNYCASSWNSPEDGRELLISALKAKEVDIDDLSELAQYWLSENEIELN